MPNGLPRPRGSRLPQAGHSQAILPPAPRPAPMDAPRPPLVALVATAALSYGAAHAIDRAVRPDSAHTALAAMDAAAPGLLAGTMATGAPVALLAALDVLVALALATLPFALLAAAARLLAWRSRRAAPPWATRAMLAATAPLRAWLAACEAAVGNLGRPTAQDAALAAALGAHTAHAMAHLTGAVALLTPYPDALTAAVSALLPGHAIPQPQGAALVALRLLDIPALFSALAASPLIATAIARVASSRLTPGRGP